MHQKKISLHRGIELSPEPKSFLRLIFIAVSNLMGYNGGGFCTPSVDEKTPQAESRNIQYVLMLDCSVEWVRFSEAEQNFTIGRSNEICGNFPKGIMKIIKI